MKKTDHQLGMNCEITRREFVQGVSLAALGLSLSTHGLAGDSAGHSIVDRDYYPPTLTGLRGSHPGAFESAHAMALEGKTFPAGESLDEEYDLVVVGGGISGLAAAYYYQQKFGKDSRILILENHDDFGGHAKRNEFHQEGDMRLSWGGTMNLERSMFSDRVSGFFAGLGIDVKDLGEKLDFQYGNGPKGGEAIYFDEASFGQDVLVSGFSFRGDKSKEFEAKIDQFPVSEESRESLKAFYRRRENVFQDKSSAEVEAILSSISYTDFLKEYGGLTEEAAGLFVKTTHGYWGVGADSLSAAECIGAGLPMLHLMGYPEPTEAWSNVGGDVAMFPDGNATIARLLVHALIPEVSENVDATNVAMARFDYSELDKPSHPVRLRLNSIAVNVSENDSKTEVSYINNGKVWGIKSKHTVLACYHVIIPHLCPQISEAQKEALRYQVKRPLILTNVLLRNSKALDKLDISGAYCPGRLHGALWQVKGVNSAGYRHDWDDPGTVPVMFWGSVAPPDSSVHVKEQHRASRAMLLAMSFEDFEREVRTVLDGMLASTGFNVQEDILAITVNRWPHGYSYDYLDLWDPDWPEGQAPHEIARKRFGNIAIANADAGADAYTHVAIDQAWRAVHDLI